MEITTPQSKIIELLSCKSETITLLRNIGDLLEDCIPHSNVWILQSSELGRPPFAIYTSARYQKALSLSEQRPPESARLYELVSKLSKEPRIADISDHPLKDEILSLLPLEGIHSLLTVRVRPSNSHSWGYVVAALPRSESEALADAYMWLEFGVTIAERRILEERLQTVETRLDLATKAGGIGIFDWDMSTNSLFWTPQEYEIYGTSPEEFRPFFEEWSKFVLPEDFANVREILEETFKRKNRYFTCSFRFRHRSNQIRWAKTLAEVIYDESGKPLRAIGTDQDITELVQTQEQLTSDRRRLELALEAGELGFWDWNIPTGVVQYGGAWAQMLGYEINEIEPDVKGWEKLTHPDDVGFVYAAIQNHLEGKTPLYESEHRLKHKNGSWVWVLSRGRIVERDAEGRPIRAIGVHSDVTLQRETRERLRQEDKRKDEFLATLAHELRNPLAPIRTGLEIIKRDRDSAAASQSLQIMERQLTHMVRLIDDLLDVSRISLGRLTLKREDISIRSVVDMAVESSRPAIDSGRHTFTTNLPQREVLINCDPTRLAQAIGNLLTNAAKYTPSGGSLSVDVENDTSGVRIRVTDNGLGIPLELQEKIFEIFGQVNRTLDRSQGGLGIGLALVRNLVTLHGGTVSVSSPGIGKGSTFTISLPATLVRNPAEGRASDTEEVSGAPHRRVLIVDDNVDAAESLAMLAKLLGHSPELAFSGHEALEKTNACHPEIVFLDIGLPGMSGLDVARVLKATHPTPYVVAVTGWGSEETKRKAREAGFDEHLTKPVDVARVEEILSRT